MFVDLDWPLNASSLLSASAELLVKYIAPWRRIASGAVKCAFALLAKHSEFYKKSICITGPFPLEFRSIGSIEQESQLMLTNPRDAFRGQSRSPCKHSTIPYVRYSFILVWNSNFVFKTRRFSDIRLQNVVTLKSGSVVTQGYWKWVPFHWLGMVYQFSIINHLYQHNISLCHLYPILLSDNRFLVSSRVNHAVSIKRNLHHYCIVIRNITGVVQYFVVRYIVFYFLSTNMWSNHDMWPNASWL